MRNRIHRLPFTTRLLLFITLVAWGVVMGMAYVIQAKEHVTTPVSVLAPHITMGTIELKVADFSAMKSFNETMVGMEDITKDDSSVTMGYHKTGVIKLINTPNLKVPSGGDPGLDQIAIVFNSRPGLAKALKRITDQNPALYAGGTDRGSVGEAFYVTDPQGNSLELYYDTDPGSWRRTTRGNIEGEAKPIDLQAYIQKYADQSGDTGMKTGHLQIRVGDITQGRKFYVDTIGFYLISDLQGLFMSDGFYHHDLVVNQAQGYDGDSIDNYLGLKGFAFSVPKTSYLNRLKNRLTQNAITYHESGNSITFTDPWGIMITVYAQNTSLFGTIFH